jgi:uncharacterized membrane protein
VGGRLGILTIFSLVLNMAAFYWVLVLYTKGHNILYMTIPMTVFFTIMLLFFMLGKNEKTLIASIATLVTVGAVTPAFGLWSCISPGVSTSISWITSASLTHREMPT